MRVNGSLGSFSGSGNGLLLPAAFIELPAFAILAAIYCTAMPVFAHAISPVLAGALCILGAGMLWAVAPAVVPVAIVTAFLFQNAFVAMVISADTAKAEFNLLRAYSFLMLATFFVLSAVWCLANRRRLDTGLFRMARACCIPLAVVGFYFLLGLQREPANAIVYLRNIATSTLCFAVGTVAAARIPGRSLYLLDRTLVGLAIAILAYGYAELIFDFSFLHLFGGDTYLNLRIKELADAGFWLKKLKETGEVVRDPTDMFRTELFNSAIFRDLRLTFYRPNGPNFHPVSFGYALSFISLCMMKIGHRVLVIAAIPLLIVVGAKGALVLFALAGLGLLLLRIGRSVPVPALMLGALGIYLALAFRIGLAIGDFHVLGFMGGVLGFLDNPLGHGLGVGGNISTDFSQIDWSSAQKRGFTNEAVESAIGVMLYQLGVGTLVLIGFLLWVARCCWLQYRKFGSTSLALACFAILIITANGILQEEALFSPLAIGIAMLYAGLALGEFASPPGATAHSPPRVSRNQCVQDLRFPAAV